MTENGTGGGRATIECWTGQSRLMSMDSRKCATDELVANSSLVLAPWFTKEAKEVS